MLRRPRSRRRRLLLPRLLPPLPERSVVPALAGAICVNFAIPFASCFVEPIDLTNPMMRPARWDSIRGRLGSSHPRKTRGNPDGFLGRKSRRRLPAHCSGEMVVSAGVLPPVLWNVGEQREILHVPPLKAEGMRLGARETGCR